jgi:hypothetical protein
MDNSEESELDQSKEACNKFLREILEEQIKYIKIILILICIMFSFNVMLPISKELCSLFY